MPPKATPGAASTGCAAGKTKGGPALHQSADTAQAPRVVRAGAPLASVYDGQRAIGFLLRRGRQSVEAFDSAERSLGVFPTMQAAARAIYCAFDGKT